MAPKETPTKYNEAVENEETRQKESEIAKLELEKTIYRTPLNGLELYRWRRY